MSSTMQNLEKLLSKPLPSTRSGAFYNTFPYPTKISPEAIAVYVASATKPGDIVLDTFSGSGSTGIAALLSEHPTEKMIMTAKEFGVEPLWGARNAVLYEIGTYAAFATKTLTNRLKAQEFSSAVNSFLHEAQKLVERIYAAQSPDGSAGTIRYAIWTEVLVCPECGEEIDYFSHGTTRNVPSRIPVFQTCADSMIPMAVTAPIANTVIMPPPIRNRFALSVCSL